MYGGQPAAATPRRILQESYSRGPGGIPPGAGGHAATLGHRKISPSAIKRFKDRVRELTTRTRGRSLRMIIGELGTYLKGWLGYFGFAETRSVFKELDSWIRRRLRSYVWKQWGRRGYKELRKRGVSKTLAWNTAKSAHGPWRLSRSPALAIALGFRYFTDLL